MVWCCCALENERTNERVDGQETGWKKKGLELGGNDPTLLPRLPRGNPTCNPNPNRLTLTASP